MNVKWQHGLTAALFFCALAGQAEAEDKGLLDISTLSEVSEDGKVKIVLDLKNAGRQTLYDVRPMFHFHHSKFMAPAIPKLEAGAKISLTNDNHPPVLRVGRYPIMIGVDYKADETESARRMQMHVDSFYYKEALESAIEGEILAEEREGNSFLKIVLKNSSSSFKNIQMMLHLPKGLKADKFKGMLGFTLRGGEEKAFEVPLQKPDPMAPGSYPVHLMIEYGQLMKHYAGHVNGAVDFGFPFQAGRLWAHAFVLIALVFALYFARLRKVKFFA